MIDSKYSDRNRIRQQLTLFIQDHKEIIEKIRKQFNPDRQKIIAAHVTLCREDEISSIEKIIANLRSLNFNSSLKITFGQVERFEDGKGVWLPGATENDQFQELRAQILKGLIHAPRKPRPHVTLMHPRNSTCTDRIFAQIKGYEFPTKIAFQ